MIRRIRIWFQESPTAVAASVGVVGGLVLFYLFTSVAYGFMLPVFADQFRRDNTRAFEITLFGIALEYQQVLANLLGALMLSAVGYVLFWRGREPEQPDSNTRDCPECKNEIWADARRCPHCTSAVVPLIDPGTEAGRPS